MLYSRIRVPPQIRLFRSPQGHLKKVPFFVKKNTKKGVGEKGCVQDKNQNGLLKLNRTLWTQSRARSKPKKSVIQVPLWAAGEPDLGRDPDPGIQHD